MTVIDAPDRPVTSTSPEPRQAPPMVAMSGLNKWFVDFHVLKDIDLIVGRGERIVIAGVGVGKSTLIRGINRLEGIRGPIVVDGIELTTTSRTRRVRSRRWCSSTSTCFCI